MGLRRKIALWICPELDAPDDNPVRAMMNTEDILKLAEQYTAQKGYALTTIATYAAGDGKFFKRLSAGATCTLKMTAQVLQWFSDNWDEDLEWPRSIPRPKPNKKEAA